MQSSLHSHTRSGSIHIPTCSSSTQYSDHNYAAREGESDLEVSTEDHVEVLALDERHVMTEPFHSPRRSLIDDASPTSIYTTESELPFDEKEDLSKIQYVGQSSGGSDSEGQKKRFGNFFRWGRKVTSNNNKEELETQEAKDVSDKDDDSNDNTHKKSDQNEQRDAPEEADSAASFSTDDTVVGVTESETTMAVKTTRSATCSYWTWFTEGFLHAGIKRGVVGLSTSAARNPYTYLIVMTVVSLGVLVAGFFTNFELIVDSDEMFTPLNALPTKHHDWLVEESGFTTIRPLLMIIHKNGGNVLGKEPLDKLFEAVDTVYQTPGYDEICEQGSFITYDNIHTCRVFSATRFWNHNWTLFQEEVTSDDIATTIMSEPNYRDGNTPVFHEMILGNYEMGNTSLQYTSWNNTFSTVNHTQRLHFVQSYFVRMELPDVGEAADDFETRALERLKELKESWQADDTNPLELDFLSIYAYKIENQRALIKDLPLVAGIFLVLVVFTTLVFYKPHPVYSRSMLGCASLLAIGMALAMSYGIVWCIGIPFTNIAQILPFMIMGVGLDDTFIITGAYFRTNPDHSVEKRMETTMNEVGLSITLTSLTTSVAFVLGSFSSIPGVKWLCWYAFSAIVVDYFFQLTYFVALVTLDERRLQAYRRNWCCCRTVPVDVDDCESQMGVIISSSVNSSDEDDFVDEHPNDISLSGSGDAGKYSHFSERFMVWYGTQLMRPWIKFLVVLVFTAYFGFCLYRATLLTQEFNVEDYTPADSYLRGTLDSLDQYYSLTKPLEVYFRGVNQSDPEIQQQMKDYVDEMAALPQIGEDAPFCWVRDFEQIGERFPQYAFLQEMDLTFNQQLSLALSNPTIREIYGEDIVVDENTGEIIASRCLLFLRNLDLTIVNDQIDMLEGQRKVTQQQPINQGLDDWKFFSFDPIFFYWELYDQAVEELLFTIVSGVAAVTFVAFVLIPHWSAIFFVCPGIIVLYIDFLGTMQLMGLHINSLTYVIICMAIGLLVDFLVHILLRYYETGGVSREEKVKETLRTMGASMFVGGLTTFLGVCPLVLSSTHIFMTVFWAFLAMVVLGFTHGLILLPVVLSMLGPIATHQIKKENSQQRTILGKKKVIDSESSTSSSSGAGYKHDAEILRSSSEEELEDLTSEEKKEMKRTASEKRTVPFLGPSYDLEIIEEGPGSRPNSTTSAKSRRSIVEAPSDEITQASPRALEPAKVAIPSSLLGTLADAYNCGVEMTEFDFYDTVTMNTCKSQSCPPAKQQRS